MFSLNKLRPVSAELTETGCMLALHYCADHREDPDRKRCKREGLAERGGGGVGGGGANCHQRKESVWLCRQEPHSRARTHTNASCNFFSPQKCLRHPRCAGKHPGGCSGFKGVDSWGKQNTQLGEKCVWMPISCPCNVWQGNQCTTVPFLQQEITLALRQLKKVSIE